MQGVVMTTRLSSVRASALPLGFLCGGSLVPPQVSVDPISMPAGLGSAVHEAMALLVDDDQVPWDQLPAIAERWHVDPVELRILVAMSAKVWPMIRSRFPRALTELALSCEIPGTDIRLTGHVDLVSGGENQTDVEVGDWKTGHKDADYREQVLAYGVLVMLDDPAIERVRVSVIWLREAEVEEYQLDRAGAQAWLARLRALTEWDGTYRPGGHCAHCKRSHECSAANALVRRDVATLLDLDQMVLDLANMPPVQIVELAKRASRLEKIAASVRDAIKAHVEASGGDIDTAEGRLLIQVEKRTVLDTVKSWPVLEAAGFGDEDFGACTAVSLSKAKDVVASKAGRGRGAAAVRTLTAALEEAGAVAQTEIRKLVTKRGTGDTGGK